ncbi:hypothetical protein [Methylobacterium sp. Gmos1]
MRYASSLISLEEVTDRLYQLKDKKFPEHDISEERDRLFTQYFAYTRAELTGKIPPTKIAEIAEWTYEQIVDLAVEHGFDITSSSQEDEDDGKSGDCNEDTDFSDADEDDEGEYGFVIECWQEWIEMMIAKDLGLLPNTTEEIEQVRLSREAKRYTRRAEQSRHRPIHDQEVQQVFGRSKDIREGTFTPTSRRGSTNIREVKVEVIRRRPYRS